MKQKAQFICAVLWLYSLSAAATAHVVDTDNERSFALAEGRPAIVLKRGDWLISKESPADNGALSYQLESKQLGALLEIQISSNPDCKSTDKCLEQAMDVRDEPLKELKQFTNGPFAAVQYFANSPNGALFKRAKVIAVAVAGDCLFAVRVVKFNPIMDRLFTQTDTEKAEPGLGEYPDAAPLTEVIKNLSIRQ